MKSNSYILKNKAFVSNSSQHSHKNMNKREKNEYLLDSGCTTHIFRTDLQEVTTLNTDSCNVTGIEGNARKGYRGTHPIFEDGIILSKCPMNLISLSQLYKQGFLVKYKRKQNKFVIKKQINNKTYTIQFKCKNKLYRACLPRATHDSKSKRPNEIGLASKIQTRGIFNDEQTRRAQAVIEIHNQLGHPSNSVLSTLLDNNSINGLDITSRDVENSRLLFGKCRGCMLGKAKNRNLSSSNSEHTDIIGKILHIDIIYFGETTQKQTYLITVDEATAYITIHYLKDRTDDSLHKAVNEAITIYKAYGHIISKICADSETGITAIKDKLAQIKIEVVQNSAGEHEKRSERMVQSIREKARAIAFSLPYQIPSMLNHYLICFTVQAINLTPNIHTKFRLPITLITGNKIKKEQIELTFGDIINCHVVNKSKNDNMAPRSESLLVVGRDLASSTFICMNLVTKKLVRRRRYTKDNANNINIHQLIEKWGSGIKHDFTKPIIDDLRDDITHISMRDAENNDHSTNSNQLNDVDTNPPTPTSILTTQNENNASPATHPIASHPTPSSLPPLSSPIPSLIHTNSLSISPMPTPVTNINDISNVNNDNNNENKRKTKINSNLSRSVSTSNLPPTRNTEQYQSQAKEHHYNTRVNPKKKLIMELAGNKATDNWSNKIPDIKVVSSNGFNDASPSLTTTSTLTTNNDNDTNASTTTNSDAMLSKNVTSNNRQFQNRLSKDPKFRRKYNKHRDKHSSHTACMTLRDGMKINPEATLAATASEIKQMFEKGVFYPIYTKDIADNQVIRSSLIITLKPNKTKARLVASGNMQDRQLYTNSEISSSTARTASILSLIAIAANEKMKISTADITGAYLNAILPEDNKVVMKIQKDVAKVIVDEMPELKCYLDHNGAMFVKIVRAIYGLIESGALWNQHLTDTLIKLGYQQLKADGCVFKKSNNGIQTFIGVYVDDLLICCDDEKVRQQLIDNLQKIYGTMKTNNDYHLTYRGLEIKQSKDLNHTTVSQIEYTKSLIKESGITGTARTPCTATFLGDKKESKPAIDPAAYGVNVAKLNWLATQSRVDIRLAVSQLSRSIHAPTIDDEAKLKRVIRYLNGTINMGLCYKKSKIKISAYADASHLVYDDCKGQSGILIYIGDSIIDSTSKRQNITAQSSTEAELISLSSAVNSVLWTKHLLEELGFPQKECIIYQDNQSCIQMGQTGKLTNRTKHLGMRYFNVYDNIKLKNIALEYKPSEQMKADFLTKTLGPSSFTIARDSVMVNIEN